MNPFVLRYILVSMVAVHCLQPFTGRAQHNSPSIRDTMPACPQAQVSDLLSKWFRLKTKKESDSVEVKAGRLYLAVVPGLGYSLQTSVTGLISANISFHTSDPLRTNLSVVYTDAEYSPTHHQLFVPFIFNVWFKENRWNAQGDMRFYRFPSITYGVGSDTRLERSDRVDYNYLKVYLSLFKPITKDLYVGFGENIDKHWNISTRDTNTNFSQYNKHATTSMSSGLYYCVKFDSRRNSNNPQGGTYCNVGIRTNFKAMGSDNDWQSVIIDARKYIKLRTRWNHIFAFWSYNWLTFGGNVPYFDLPSTSWDTYSNTGRGYAQGRLRGKNFLYAETEYRFDITCNGLWGGVVFANAQTVNTNDNRNFQTVLPAFGTGLRVKLNKKSGVNFAVDYAVGINGSRGFFFNVSEVF